MQTKHLYAAAASTLVVSALVVWSCVGSEGENPQSDPETAFRGFNEPLSGAIFTTLSDGTTVNANIYAAKQDVYLDGGPGIHAPISAAGLPEGDYYFQVTDPSGKDLLSEDHISCRKVHVNEAGVISQVYAGRNYAWRRGWVEEPCQHLTGVDEDHGADGAITVELMPYANTPNRGGVYKVWMTPVEQYLGDPDFVPQNRHDEVNGELWEPGNFHGFVPAHSKTDNYKVKKNGKPQFLTLRKFHDSNVNGVFDDGEQEIQGWAIAVNDPTGSTNTYYTPTELLVHEGLWATQESMPAGSRITAAYLDGAQLSAFPDADPLVLVRVDGTSDERHEVVYGDVGVGSASACKVYDSDGDGEVDEGELGVAGWRFQLDGTDLLGRSVGPLIQTTGVDGCTSFVDLLPGRYTISEANSGGDWIASGPATQTFDVSSTLTGATLTGTSTELSFTNYCKGTAGFGTKGYWHNKNGLAELRDEDIEYANGLTPYASPSTYFTAGDEPFDGLFADGTPVAAAQEVGEELAPAGSARAEVSQFLVGSNRDGDPREQLAQQLLAFVFNVRNRLDGPRAGVQLPDGSFVTAQSLIEQATAAWEGDDAALQTEIKDTLDAFNNSEAVVFIYATPCDLP